MSPSSNQDFLGQLRESTDSNRTEFLKHISIVSVAGLGFNLVKTRPDDFTWDYPSFIWWLSSGGFLVAVFCIIGMFYLASIHAEALYRAYNAPVSATKKQQYLAKAKNREIWLKWVGGAIPFIFTTATISAIVVVVLQ